MMKKTIFIVLILILLFTLVGCAEVTYSVNISDGGARVYEYKVTLDSNNSDTPKNIAIIRTFFEYQKDKNPYAEVVFDDETPNTVIYRISYDSQEEYYEALGITGDEPNDDPTPYTEQGLFRVYEGIVFDMDKEDFASYALNFLSFYDRDLSSKIRECLKKYINNSSISNGTNESVIRVCNSSEDTVSALRTELSVSESANELAEITYQSLKTLGYDYSQVVAYFEYSHVYKSISGVNPDKTETVATALGKTKVYTWNIDLLGSNEIKITQTTPNVWLWELIAILFGILVALITFALFFVRRKKLEKSLSSYNQKVFEQTNIDSESTNRSERPSSRKNGTKVSDEEKSQYASWFGYTESQIKGNRNNEQSTLNTNTEDVFDGYFNENSKDNTDSTDNNED